MSMSSLDRPIPGVGVRSGVEVAGLGATAGAGTIRLITSYLPSAGASAGFQSPPRLTAVEPHFRPRATHSGRIKRNTVANDSWKSSLACAQERIWGKSNNDADESKGYISVDWQ